jgi:RNA polymerase sigma-70 factor (ECF subfamily)
MDASLDTIRAQVAALVPRLRRFALSVTGNRADADDLVQDTLERALRHLDQWQPGTRLYSWMFRIEQNLFIVQGARPGANARLRRHAGRWPMPAMMASALLIPYDGARRAPPWRLCPRISSAVALVLIDGMPHRAAADVLGVPIGT